jgi:hypothetical protein
MELESSMRGWHLKDVVLQLTLSCSPFSSTSYSMMETWWMDWWYNGDRHPWLFMEDTLGSTRSSIKTLDSRYTLTVSSFDFVNYILMSVHFLFIENSTVIWSFLLNIILVLIVMEKWLLWDGKLCLIIYCMVMCLFCHVSFLYKNMRSVSIWLVSLFSQGAHSSRLFKIDMHVYLP